MIAPLSPVSPSPRDRVIAVIPARLASTRLPRKVLRPVAGIPLLGWVYRAALACPQFDQVVIAADSTEVGEYAVSQGWMSVMTSPGLASGTDRVHAVAGMVDADIYVNLQGDEPLLRPEHIEALLRPFSSRLHPAAVATVATACPSHQTHDPNVVKVVTANDGRALYFSRAPIPFHRDTENRDSEGATGKFRKHLGIYAYRREALHRFASLAPGPLELTERLEQLRLLENGIDIYVEETPFDTIGVDTEEDLAAVERELLNRPPYDTTLPKKDASLQR